MIEAEVSGAVGRVTLNSPATHNALDRAAMDALMRVLEDWSGRPDLRVLVLTGAGRSFCSGASLGEVTQGGLDGRPPDGALRRAGGVPGADRRAPQWRRLWRWNGAGALLRLSGWA